MPLHRRIGCRPVGATRVVGLGAGRGSVVGAERGACAGPPVVLRACQVAMGLGMLAMLLAL